MSISISNLSAMNENSQAIQKSEKNISYRAYSGGTLERVPESDTYNKKSAKKVVGTIAGLLLAAALVLGGICYHKGKPAEGVEKKFSERLKDGWKELWGTAEKAAEGGADKPNGGVDKAPKENKKQNKTNRTKKTGKTKKTDESKKTEAAKKSGAKKSGAKKSDDIAGEDVKLNEAAPKQPKKSNIKSSREYMSQTAAAMNMPLLSEELANPDSFMFKKVKDLKFSDVRLFMVKMFPEKFINLNEISSLSDKPLSESEAMFDAIKTYKNKRFFDYFIEKLA